MKLARRTAAVTAVTVVVSGSALALAGPASAAESVGPVATYNGACGTGYKVIDSADMENLGTTFLTYNKTTGENCVVTVRARAGAPVYMFASLSSPREGKATDNGRFTTYAGPVYLQARGQCVTWEGGITTYSTSATGHCG
ncbi:spore-associated protein A [Streptomyces sp. NPDC021212]|uniref:spore-associated protein A n=1 Tax=Streptomyces sp. NPDC021212 TaxID=3365118 RepID=UPI0037AFD57E